MSSYMEYEGLLVLISMGTGILLVLAYELLAAFRRAVPHHPMASSGEDFIYWAFTGLFLFAVLYRYNQGSIRFFFLLGCFCGAWIGRRTVAPLFGKTVDIIFGIPVFFVKFSTKWLLFMIKRCNIFLCRVIRTLKTAITRIFRTAMGSSRVEKIKKTEKQKKYSE